MTELREIEPIIRELEPVINRGDKRLCHKVRTARYYGGIATVDVVGCYLDCAYCWVPDYKKKIEGIMSRKDDFRYLSGEEAANILIKLAEKNGLRCVRLSGGEPTLHKNHLLRTIELTTKVGYKYIFETNGLLLDGAFLEELQPYRPDILVYFSLKGNTPAKFSELTLRSSEYWQRQFDALKLLIEYGFIIGINLMSDYLDENELLVLIEELRQIHKFAPLALDLKRTTIFPHIRNRLEARVVNRNKAVITNKSYEDILKRRFEDLYSLGGKHRISLGIMNFYDFEKANKQNIGI